MTTTVADDTARIILNECDANTGWTGSATVVAANAPVAIEATNQLGMGVSTATHDAYVSITSDDYSGGGSLSVWVQANGNMDTLVNGGIMIQVTDGTNYVGYHVGGSDKSAFRHDDGPVKWECYLLDLANKPANFTALTGGGSEASLDETAITEVGVAFKTLSKALGGGTNCYWDIIRFADNGDAVTFVGGTTSGAAGSAAEMAVLDRAVTNQQALGVIRELGVGVYGIQGNIILGDSSSASDQFWTEAFVTYSWEDRGLSTNNYYRFALIGSSTATNCEFSFTSTTFTVPSAASASFDGNGADITVCNMLSCSFIGFDVGIETSDDTGDLWTNCAFIANDEVVANGCDLSGSSFSEYVGAANGACLTYDLNVDPDGELDDLTFSKTSGTAHHAIDFGANIPTSAITLRGCAFGTDFSASENTSPTAEAGDETFAFRDTTGTLTVNLVGCTGNFGFYSAGVVITIVADPATTKFTVQDSAGDPIDQARVLVETADNGGGSGFPYQAAVTTLSSSAGTATLTASAVHGLATGDYVVVRGAQPDDYNKQAQITVTSTTVFTYAVTSGISSPATGTPVFSYAPISGLTATTGIIQSSKVWPASQGLIGWARKSTSSPFYRQTGITVADASGGTDATVTLQSDE